MVSTLSATGSGNGRDDHASSTAPPASGGNARSHATAKLRSVALAAVFIASKSAAAVARPATKMAVKHLRKVTHELAKRRQKEDAETNKGTQLLKLWLGKPILNPTAKSGSGSGEGWWNKAMSGKGSGSGGRRSPTSANARKAPVMQRVFQQTKKTIRTVRVRVLCVGVGVGVCKLS